MKNTRHPWAPRAGAASRSFRLPAVRTGLGLALGVLLGASCNINVQSIFTCVTDEDCTAEGGTAGTCEPNSLCTFPDASCPSGKRWHGRAGELADKCYEPGDVGDSTGTETVAGTATGATEGSSSSSDGGGSTSLPSDDSSSGAPPVTDGGSSSGGPAATCDETFGAAPGYLLCEETPDTCSFNATLTMTSCDAMCMMFGSTCTAAFTNMASDCASIDVATTCDDATAMDHICVCAKP